MILTTSTLTQILQNRRFTWDLSQKRSFSSHLATANPNGTAWFNTSKAPLWNCKSQWNYDANVSLSRNPAPAQRNASPFLRDIPLLCKSQWNSGTNWHVTHPWKVTFWSSPQRQRHRSRIRTMANTCGRLRTRKQRPANTALPSDSQVKREPFATHSGKKTERENTTRSALRRSVSAAPLGVGLVKEHPKEGKKKKTEREDTTRSALRRSVSAAPLGVGLVKEHPKEGASVRVVLKSKTSRGLWKEFVHFRGFEQFWICSMRVLVMNLRVFKGGCRVFKGFILGFQVIIPTLSVFVMFLNWKRF